MSTIQLLHADIKQNLADILYCYSSQSGLSSKTACKLLDHLSKVTPNTASGALDDINLALMMAALASFDVSGADSENEDMVPMVKDKDFIADVSRELECRGGRKWETQGNGHK